MAGVGIGASLIAGRVRSVPDVPSPFLRADGFVVGADRRHLSFGAGADVIFAANRGSERACGPRLGRSGRARFDGCRERLLRASAGSAGGSGAAVVGRTGAGLGVTITGILPVRAGSLGRCGAAAAAAVVFGMPRIAFDELPTRSASSSVRLASADPLPGRPALVQMSTNSLLSSFSSFASA